MENNPQARNFLREGDVMNPDSFFGLLPPGYTFNPTDEQLIFEYLKPKILNQPLPINKIRPVNLYLYSPEQISDFEKSRAEKAMYFFTARDRKYPHGIRPNRVAGYGHWKPTGADIFVGIKEGLIGYRKELVYYIGNRKDSIETNWIMHEYRIDQMDAPSTSGAPHDKKMCDWVLCRLYNKEENNPYAPGMDPGMFNPHAQMCGDKRLSSSQELQTNQCPPLSKKPRLSDSAPGDDSMP